jgi:hypothetical protein
MRTLAEFRSIRVERTRQEYIDKYKVFDEYLLYPYQDLIHDYNGHRIEVGALGSLYFRSGFRTENFSNTLTDAEELYWDKTVKLTLGLTRIELLKDMDIRLDLLKIPTKGTIEEITKLQQVYTAHLKYLQEHRKLIQP